MAETRTTDSSRTHGQRLVEDETPIVGAIDEYRRGPIWGRVGAGAAILVTAGALGLTQPDIAASAASGPRSERTGISPASGRRLTNSGVVDLAIAESLTNSVDARIAEVPLAAPERRDPALPSHDDALTQIANWLQMSDGEMAELVGVSRRTVVNWHAGRGGYGATTRKLFSTHALISQLVMKEGLERTRLWLNSLASDGTKTRLQMMASGADGFAAVLRQAEPILFPTSVPPRPEVDNADRDLSSDEAQSAALADGPRLPEAFKFEPRRPRRLS